MESYTIADTVGGGRSCLHGKCIVSKEDLKDSEDKERVVTDQKETL